MSNEAKPEQSWVVGKAWDDLQFMQFMQAYGCPAEIADELLRRARVIKLQDDVRVASILRAWGA